MRGELVRLAVRETTGVGSYTSGELAPSSAVFHTPNRGRERTLESLLNPTDEESLLRGEWGRLVGWRASSSPRLRSTSGKARPLINLLLISSASVSLPWGWKPEKSLVVVAAALISKLSCLSAKRTVGVLRVDLWRPWERMEVV